MDIGDFLLSLLLERGSKSVNSSTSISIRYIILIIALAIRYL